MNTDVGIRIGDIEFSNRLALAPMAGISDPPFRRLCSRLGATMTPSEMVTADTRLWKSKKSQRRLSAWRNRTPRIIQIAGFDPDMLASAALEAQNQGANILDINMGCPAKKVCRRLAGSALLRDPDLVRRILQEVISRSAIPVTLKIRTGWCPESRNGVEIARIAEDCGIAALTVHGRTRACKFSGHAEYETIRQIKKSVSIPIIANGDIDSPEKAKSVLDYTSADAIMIGRGARGNPWIFSRINSYLSDTLQPELPFVSVRDIILAHLDSLYSFYGEFTGVRVGRKHLTWYFQHQDGARDFCQRIVHVETAQEQLKLTQFFLDRNPYKKTIEYSSLQGKCVDRIKKQGKNPQQTKDKYRGNSTSRNAN
jgi:tRNA-dihydrouridine synthase B